ncbi:MAG: MarR family transcriptional regulator [Sediminibacterium sp.]|nr:MarR family transcriptional regulator [Sediminibacterium sp.]
MNENEIAENLQVVISRLIKLLRSETKNDEMLSLTERSTLAQILQNGEILPSALALIEKVSNQSMSQTVNKLLRHGYIRKTVSGEDKRKVIVTVTTAGKKLIEKKRHEKEEWLAKSITDKTTQKEKQILIQATQVLTKLIK